MMFERSRPHPVMMPFPSTQNLTPYVVSLHGFHWLIFNSKQYQSFQIVGEGELINVFTMLF